MPSPQPPQTLRELDDEDFGRLALVREEFLSAPGDDGTAEPSLAVWLHWDGVAPDGVALRFHAANETDPPLSTMGRVRTKFHLANAGNMRLVVSGRMLKTAMDSAGPARRYLTHETLADALRLTGLDIRDGDHVYLGFEDDAGIFAGKTIEVGFDGNDTLIEIKLI